MVSRIGREYVAQMAAFAVAIADRLLTAGVLVRLWGSEGFAAWTVALSAAGLLALCDFGLTSYFSNRLFFAVEQGETARARHIFGAGNAAVLVAGLIGLVVVVASFRLFGKPVGNMAAGTTLLWCVILMALATALRRAMAVVFAAYTAHQDFFRQTMVVAAGNALQVSATIAAALLGGGLLIVSLTYFVSTVLAASILPAIDVARRYPGFAYRLEIPDYEERRAAFKTSLQYWAQGGVITLVTFAPVFFLSGAGAAPRVIVQFALMRTLANLVRAVLQLFANVFGLEGARRIAIADRPGFSQTYRESTIFLAVQSAASAGVLAALAQPLFTVWTGDATLFDSLLLWLAVGPPLLLPSLAMGVQVLTCANLPAALLTGRTAQLVLTVLSFFLLPVPDLATRMMLALVLGEVAGLGLPVTRAILKLDPHAGMGLHLSLIWRSAAAALVAYFVVSVCADAFAHSIWLQLTVGLTAGLAVLTALTLSVGITKARRATLLKLFRSRIAPRATR